MSTYWSGQGKFQEDYDRLQELVPFQGESNIPEIELLRVTSNLYYDCYNNGLCNEHRLFDAVSLFRLHENSLKPLLQFPSSIDQFLQLAYEMQAYEVMRKSRCWNEDDEEGLDRWEDDFEFNVKALFAPLEDVTNAVIQFAKGRVSVDA